MAKTLTKEEKQAAHEDEVSRKLQEQAAQKELAEKQAAEKAALEKKLADERAAMPVSATKAEFKKVIEAYKVQNPIKYELKKEELERKLAALK